MPYIAYSKQRTFGRREKKNTKRTTFSCNSAERSSYSSGIWTNSAAYFNMFFVDFRLSDIIFVLIPYLFWFVLTLFFYRSVRLNHMTNSFRLQWFELQKWPVFSIKVFFLWWIEHLTNLKHLAPEKNVFSSHYDFSWQSKTYGHLNETDFLTLHLVFCEREFISCQSDCYVDD